MKRRSGAVVPGSAWAPGKLALIWVALCALLVIHAWPRITGGVFTDPDDVLRLVQVRDLLGGQGWFDLHQYRIDPPGGTLMHWSRLVDLPLALVIGALSPLLGGGAAEHVAVVAVPLLTLGAIVLVVARMAARFLDPLGVTLSCVALGLAPLLMAQVQPLRIDHHGWQIFSVMLAMTGLLPGKPLRGAAVAGAALALGLSISLEILPIAAAFGAVFALRWLSDGKSGEPLATFLAALAGMLALLFLASRGLVDLAQHCDAISPGHLGLFAIAGAVTAGVLAARPGSRLTLGILLALAGASAAGFYLWVAPHCAAGPFGSLDPLVREFWYNNVSEGRPAWRVAPATWLPIVAQGVVALAALAFLWRRAAGAERRWWFEYLLVTAAAFATGLLVWRSLAFVGALSAFPLGWLAARLLRDYGTASGLARKLGLAAALVLALVPAFPVALATSAFAGEAANDDRIPAVKACQLSTAATALNQLDRGTVFAPLDVGPTLLHSTGHSVVATSHHRAATAMHDVIAAFLGAPELAEALVRKHRARYLLVCEDLVEFRMYARKASAGLAAHLAAGRAPAWLEPIAIDGPPGLRVWRVRERD